jgi:hypothetical protein
MMVGTVLIVIDMLLVPVPPRLSVTFTVNRYTPDVVGIPERTPVNALRVRPFGNVPAETDQLYGSVPPDAAKVWL